MTRYDVQYVLPVNNPLMSVSRTVGKTVIHFEVPINHPDAHKMGFTDLMAATELSGLFTVSTTHNRNNRKGTIKHSSKECEQPGLPNFLATKPKP